MKMTISPASEDAVAPISNEITSTTSFAALSPLAFMFLLHVVHKWDRRQLDLKHRPWKRGQEEDRTYRVLWRELQTDLLSRANPSVSDRNYSRLKAAVEEVFDYRVDQAWGKRSFAWTHLLQDASYDERGKSVLTYTITRKFAQALEALGGGYGLVPLADAKVLHDIRALLMLTLAAKMVGRTMGKARTLSVDWLRWHFNLQGKWHGEWRNAFAKLKVAADAVSAKTSFAVTLHPVMDEEDKRRVAGLRINVSRRKPSALAVQPQQRFKPRLIRPSVPAVSEERKTKRPIILNRPAAVVV